MTFKYEMDTTANKRVYRVSRKNALAEAGEIHCSYCKYHKNENKTAYKKFKSKPKSKDHR